VSVTNLIGSVSALLKLEGAERVNAFADALQSGTVSLSTPSGVLQSSLGVPENRLRSYREALIAADSVANLVLALRVGCETAKAIGSAQPVVEVAWTYPGRSRPGLRTTGGVAREVVMSSRHTLLLVGYSITVDPTLTGLAAQTIDAIASAAERGVVVTAVLHHDVNPLTLLQAWRPGVRRPSIFRWAHSDDKASVHAKLLIADRVDALVTSANLTYHGLQGNLEMGLRVKGGPAGEIYDRIQELISAGELVSWAT
jgi:PLD-like domain